MTSGEGSPASRPADLRKDPAGPGTDPIELRKDPIELRKPAPGERRPAARPPERTEDRLQGPAWLVLPIRAVALIVFVPLRLVHELLVQIGRGLRALWNGLMRALGGLGRLIGRALRGIWRGLYRGLLAPIGRLLVAFVRGIGTLLTLLIVRPVRWFAVVVVYGLARWIYRALLVPLGRLLAMAGRGLAWLLGRALLRPLWAVLRGLGWLLARLGAGLVFLLDGLVTVLRLLLNVLVVIPSRYVWRYLLRPLLLGLRWVVVGLGRGVAWLGRGLLVLLRALGKALAAVWQAVAWAGIQVGRFVAWVVRILVVLPLQVLWRYVLSPIGAGLLAAWRLAGRVLRWLWRTFVVLPVRVLVVAPARWVTANVLRPVGRGIRGAWRTVVGEPFRAARRTVRQAGRDVRLQLRRAFRGL